jgi:hypothetical protein
VFGQHSWTLIVEKSPKIGANRNKGYGVYVGERSLVSGGFMKRFFEIIESQFSEGFQGVSTNLHHIDEAGSIVIDDPSRLFGAEFTRDGTDLVLKNNGAEDIRIVDYFGKGIPPDLVTSEGGKLTGATVEKLAGPAAPGQYAQAG